MKSEIVKVDLSQYGLEETKAAEIRKDFDAVLKIASELESEYNDIVAEASKEITPDVVKKAKIVRNKYVKVRTGIAAVHKERKAFYLSGGRAVDGLKNAYTHAVQGNENKLKEIETHFERIEKERLEKLQIDRAEKLSLYVEDASERDLSRLADDEFEALLAMKKKEHEDRIEAERKAEEERIAKEKAEAEERERIRKENERLKAEAEEREKKAKAEQMAREKEERERVAKEEAERKRIEEERRKEREEAEAKLAAERAERERVEAEQKAKEEAERKEKEDAEAREKDRAHRSKINNQAHADLIESVDCLTDKLAKDVVIAIAKGQISNVKISY